jgi:hypothetical protein
MNLKEVWKAWVTSFNPNDEERKIAEERLEVCKKCEEWGELPLLPLYAYCKKCLCPIDKKIFAESNESCPLKKWNND